MRLSHIRRGQRDRNYPGIHTSKEGGDKLEACGIQQQSTLSACSVALEQCSYGSRLRVEALQGQIRFFYLSVGQVSVDFQLRMLKRSRAKKIDEC